MTSNKNVVEQWFGDMVNEGKLELAEELVHPDYRDGPNHEGPTGPEFVRAKFSGMASAVSDVRIDIDQLIEEGNNIACKYHTKMTVNDSFMGVHAPGALIEYDGVTFFEFENGKIFYTWGTYDRQGIIKQLQQQD